GAAVRDETGRTYAAAAVALPSLRLSALHLAVAMAASSGASSLEAAALVSDGPGLSPVDLAAVRDLGPAAIGFHAASDRTVRAGRGPARGCGVAGRPARHGRRWRSRQGQPDVTCRGRRPSSSARTPGWPRRR